MLHALVLLEGGQQIEEWLRRDGEAADGFAQGEEHVGGLLEEPKSCQGSGSRLSAAATIAPTRMDDITSSHQAPAERNCSAWVDRRLRHMPASSMPRLPSRICVAIAARTPQVTAVA